MGTIHSLVLLGIKGRQEGQKARRVEYRDRA